MPDGSPRPYERLRRWLWRSACVAALPLTGLGALLMCTGETLGGRLAGSSVVLLSLGAWAWEVSRIWPRRRRLFVRVAAIAAGLGLAYLVWAYAGSPSGRIPASPFSQNFAGNAHFRRWSPANIVPEIDQLKLGTYLIPAVDPVMDWEQSKRVRQVFLGIYREEERDPAFRKAGSRLGMAYEDVFLERRSLLHLYSYVPEGSLERLPVIIFLHGSLGNFKGYLWVLKNLADKEQVAIVAPTYGTGNWRNDPTCEVVLQTLAWCEANPRLDASRVVLAGLSNGGLGVTAAMGRLPDRFAGFIAISPVLDSRLIQAKGFGEGLRDKPLLVIYGQDDRRVPAAFVEAQAATLEYPVRMLVTRQAVPAQDHFLFFDQPSEVCRTMGDWLEATGALKGGAGE